MSNGKTPGPWALIIREDIDSLNIVQPKPIDMGLENNQELSPGKQPVAPPQEPEPEFGPGPVVPPQASQSEPEFGPVAPPQEPEFSPGPQEPEPGFWPNEYDYETSPNYKEPTDNTVLWLGLGVLGASIAGLIWLSSVEEEKS